MKGLAGIEAQVIEDSVNMEDPDNQVRLTTFQLKYPRFIHAEFMTHRVFSRNASSSRAIPVKTNLQRIEEYPARPIHWGKNQPGMQAREEHNAHITLNQGGTFASGVTFMRMEYWQQAAKAACGFASDFNDAGYHKQIVNRLTEPFQFISVVATVTELDNFFTLRLHPDAQPEFQELARLMKISLDSSVVKPLQAGEWHLPYITPEDMYKHSAEECRKISVARCARVSYLNHDKSQPDTEKDLGLYEMLKTSGHYSPFEHQATPLVIPRWNLADLADAADQPAKGVTHYDTKGWAWSGNFRGWSQNRHWVEQELSYD